MREFPSIDMDVENDAVHTLFFTDWEVDGRPCRISKFKYLSALSLRGPEVSGEIEKLRAELMGYPLEQVECDIGRLYAARNWRAHLIACVALTVGFATERATDALWQCLRLGSWASPQLASTAAFVDPAFANQASVLVTEHATYYKSIVALASLLARECGVALPQESPAANNLAEALALDRDNSGHRAEKWLANLRFAVGSVYSPISHAPLTD